VSAVAGLSDRLAAVEGYAEASPLPGVDCGSCELLRAGRCELFGDRVSEAGVCRFWVGTPREAVDLRPRPLPAEVHACVRLLAEAASAVPLTWEGTPLRDERGPRLLRRPAPGVTRGNLVAAVMVDLLTEGDAFLLKVRGPEGEVVELSPVSPHEVEADVDGWRVNGVALPARALIRASAPVQVAGRGLPPLAEAARAGLELADLAPAQVCRLFRVPPARLGLEGPDGDLRDALRPWLGGLAEALSADEDLCPAERGLSLSFRLDGGAAPPPPPAPSEDHSAILAAILELARREPPTLTVHPPAVTVEAPPAPSVEVQVTQGGSRKTIKRDADGNIAEIIEEPAER
jgi:hypothetical protein